MLELHVPTFTGTKGKGWWTLKDAPREYEVEDQVFHLCP